MSCTENLKLFKTTEKNDSAIDRASQFICKAKVTSLSEADGLQLWHVSDTDIPQRMSGPTVSIVGSMTTNGSPSAEPYALAQSGCKIDVGSDQTGEC